MKEWDGILSEWRGCREAVLTTVVHVEGSAYRRPGARMLILPDGRRIGSISGGCLEGDVCQKAWWFTEGGRPSVRVYDTSSDDDAVWEFGLGCNGIVHVLFERVQDPHVREMLSLVAEARAAGRALAVATVVGVAASSTAQLGSRLLLDRGGVRGGALAHSPMQAEVLGELRECFLHQKSHLAHLPGYDLFVEWIGPPPCLVIFGAGHDAQPLVRFASELGWQVTVADGRATHAQPARFPGARQVVVIDPQNPMRGIEIARTTAVVMMTHNYAQDAKLLRHILPAKPRYLGMLGPKSRTEDLLEEVALPLNGIAVHGPVGLDLGSDAPESIALAVVAEIQAVLKNRSGGMLKYRRGSIHDRVVESGSPGSSLLTQKETAVCELV